MKKTYYLLLIFALFTISCATTVKVDAEERYPKIIAEKAYTEFNNKRYKTAIAYYQYIIDNFDRNNFAKDVSWAYYEIGFGYYYQNKYEEAIDYFNIVINDFSVLPPKVLAQKVMQDIYTKKPKLKPIETVEEVIIDEDIEQVVEE